MCKYIVKATTCTFYAVSQQKNVHVVIEPTQQQIYESLLHLKKRPIIMLQCLTLATQLYFCLSSMVQHLVIHLFNPVSRGAL